MTRRTARQGAGLAIAALAFICVLLLIAFVGGGWWALGRVDPVLAVPGAGWAAVAALVVRRGRANMRAVLAMATGGTLALAGIAATVAGRCAALELAIVFVALAVASTVVAAAPLAARRVGGGGVRRRVVAAVLLSLIAIGWQQASWAIIPGLYRSVPAAKPRITILTSLPLEASDGLQAAVRGEVVVEPILTILRRSNRVTLDDGPMPARLADTDVLLLAHPRALAPETLVRIDAWVRDGGRALILADGLLTWPAPHSLGDPRNPPVTSLLTPLLSHWGLRLDAPSPDAALIDNRMDGSLRLRVEGAGGFKSAGGLCRVSVGGLRADCRIGRGAAILLADADLLQRQHWAGPARRGAAAWSSANAEWLRSAIIRLSGHDESVAMVQPTWWPAINQP